MPASIRLDIPALKSSRPAISSTNIFTPALLIRVIRSPPRSLRAAPRPSFPVFSFHFPPFHHSTFSPGPKTARVTCLCASTCTSPFPLASRPLSPHWRSSARSSRSLHLRRRGLDALVMLHKRLRIAEVPQLRHGRSGVLKSFVVHRGEGMPRHIHWPIVQALNACVHPTQNQHSA